MGTRSVLLFSVFFLAYSWAHGAKDHTRSSPDVRLEDGFFVSRKDNLRATCISKERNNNHLEPGYDLDKLQLSDGGFVSDWTMDWTWKNFELNADHYYRRFNGHFKYYAFTDGSSKFQPLQPVGYQIANEMFGFLASNASLWLVGEFENPEEAGVLVQIDHLNLTSGTKFTRAMSCQKMPQNKEQEDKCDTLKISTTAQNILNDGIGWVPFYFYGGNDKNSFGLSSVIEGSKKINFVWPRPKTYTALNHKVFVRSHNKPGVFFETLVEVNPLKPTASDNGISRNFSFHQTIGNFCVALNGWQLTSDFELLNLDTQKVLTSGQLDTIIHQSNWTVVKVEFKDLQPGNYQLTYKNIKGLLSYIDMCPGERIDRKIFMPPQTPNHCWVHWYLTSDFTHFTTRTNVDSSGPTNATLKTNWDSGEWDYVCDQLRVPQDNLTKERVPIKFCHLYWGCNAGFCPHQHKDEQKATLQMPVAKVGKQ